MENLHANVLVAQISGDAVSFVPDGLKGKKRKDWTFFTKSTDTSASIQRPPQN